MIYILVAHRLLILFTIAIFALIAWGIFKEFKNAYIRDEQENKLPHIKRLLIEYVIIIIICIATYAIVNKVILPKIPDIGDALYGPVYTVPDSPLYKDVNIISDNN